MNKTQVLKRLSQSIIGEIKENDEELEEPEKVEIPYFSYNEELKKYEIKHRIRNKKGINYNNVKSKIKAMKMRIKNGALKIICAPMNSMTTNDISNMIDEMVLDGFVPDVIITDYADVTLSTMKGDYRHRLDDIWKGYKNIALAKHCVVVTATHSNKSTYEKDIKQGDASEDIRKMNHVSIMITLDQNDYEKSIGIMRTGVSVHRHMDFNLRNKVVVLENKRIGRCYLNSKWRREVYYKLEEKE
jgi:hypothetical protein